MSTLREAAQQALEAYDRGLPVTAATAMGKLRSALAQEDEMQEMLRTLGFDHQCPESIGITLRRWRDGYAAAQDWKRITRETARCSTNTKGVLMRTPARWRGR